MMMASPPVLCTSTQHKNSPNSLSPSLSLSLSCDDDCSQKVVMMTASPPSSLHKRTTQKFTKVSLSLSHAHFIKTKNEKKEN